MFRLLGKDPEAVVVSFLTGTPEQNEAMLAEVKQLMPDRRHFVVRERSDLAALKGYRIGMAPVLFNGDASYGRLRGAAFLAAPGRILAYNARLERHHLQLRTALASLLFLRGVPLDRIWLRPRWWPLRRERSVYPDGAETLEGRAPSPLRRRLAILTPYLPWPLSHGGAVRIYNLLKDAAADNDIHLLAFRDPLDDPQPLLSLCARITLVTKPRYREPRWSTLLPPEVHEFDSPAMHRVWRECQADLRQVEYTQLAPYGGDILVEHDVTFDLYRQVHAERRTLSSWWDYRRWRRFEEAAVARYPRVVTMSGKDSALLGGGAHLREIANGVDLDRFRPEPETAGRRLLFIGSFRHFPNQVAFRFLLEEVLPRLEGVTVTVVAGPDPELHWGGALPSLPNLHILSFVADVRPLYVEANLVLVPTLVSAGTNLKVLEAMAMERAVVSTPSGCAGIGLVHRQSVWVAEGGRAFAQGIEALLADADGRARLAGAARRIAMERFGWQSLGERQRDLYAELAPPAAGCVVRRAVAGDVSAIAAIQAESPEASHWEPERYLQYDCRVAVLNGEVAGFLVARETAPGEREILNLAVAGRFRRKGIATRLLAVQLRDGAAVFLEVRESNRAARALYEKYGFTAAGTRKNYYTDPCESAIVMRFKSC
ncbi:MAG: GNAT family N-acetyltransferase [Bryobacteraceae bacterium]|nr:GNAT family N-acetyltransferase [Bryobacteraceae bacterium]